jgi:acyl-CoA thioester hydrolase
MARFRTALSVRFRDIDWAGMVNNAVYLTYLEEARVRFWIHLTQQIPQQSKDISLVVARVEMDYLKPVRLGDKLWVELWVSRMGRTSFDFSYRLLHFDGTPVGRARTVMVHVTPEGQPHPLPRDMVEQLTPYLEEDPSP